MDGLEEQIFRLVGQSEMGLTLSKLVEETGKNVAKVQRALRRLRDMGHLINVAGIWQTRLKIC
jgi:DNA-binding IclR family transcriptional regulator